MSRGNILYVGGSGPGNYSRIQDAIDNASDGDTIFVYSGLFYENIQIPKSIYLIGEDKNSTIIDGNNSGDVVIIIKDFVSINKFTIRNGVNGIYILSNNNTIISNNISKNEWRGILSHESKDNIITDNVVSQNNQDGLYLCDFSSHNVVTNNIISENNGSGIVIFVDSDNNNITSNIINANNKANVNIQNSENNLIVNNIICCSKKRDGILLLYSKNNTINSNTINENDGDGIGIHWSSRNTITNNTISINKLDGIRLLYSNSTNNNIYHNNFIDNNQNAYDDGNNNQWNNNYPSCGNYWDSYTGDDVFWGQNQEMNGSDGVGDTPYDISGGDNKDMYPLMEPYGMTTLSLDFRGGLFKCSGIIKNIGNNTAFNVQWNIEIDGGIVLFGRATSGTLPKPLLAGEETQVSSHLILGFGSIILTIAIWADNAPYYSKSTPGKLLLFFIKI